MVNSRAAYWKTGKTARAFHNRIKRLVAGSVARFLRLFHFLTQLRFNSIEVEARATLHRRVLEEGLDFLAHHLLDEHKAPELILEPLKIFLRPFFCAIAGPAGAFERIEAQVD